MHFKSMLPVGEFPNDIGFCHGPNGVKDTLQRHLVSLKEEQPIHVKWMDGGNKHRFNVNNIMF